MNLSAFIPQQSIAITSFLSMMGRVKEKALAGITDKGYSLFIAEPVTSWILVRQ